MLVTLTVSLDKLSRYWYNSSWSNLAFWERATVPDFFHCFWLLESVNAPPPRFDKTHPSSGNFLICCCACIVVYLLVVVGWFYPTAWRWDIVKNYRQTFVGAYVPTHHPICGSFTTMTAALVSTQQVSGRYDVFTAFNISATLPLTSRHYFFSWMHKPANFLDV